MVIEKMKASMEKRLENAPLEAVARGLGFNASSYRSCVVSRNRVSHMLTMYNRMLIQIFDEGGFGEFSLGYRGRGESQGRLGRAVQVTLSGPRSSAGLGGAVRAAEFGRTVRVTPFGPRYSSAPVESRSGRSAPLDARSFELVDRQFFRKISNRD